ncbi:MAG TPA: DUF1735 domain-containing protein, partial [Ferruginibacter sp.]|nr:DUF1735 domain-containing protein [Ferruginibacter sp.]
LDLSSSSQTISNQATIMLLSSAPAQSDISVTLEIDPTIIDNYNNTNGTSIEVLDPSLYNISSLTVVIPRGSKQIDLPIVIPSTATLDANSTYGIGVRIASADAGYVLSSNMRELLISIGLKNRWDGVYELKGYHNRNPYTFPYDVEMNMETYGPADDIFFWPDVDDYGHPIGVAPGSVNWYGPAIQPVVTFDPATDLVTGVRNVSTTSTTPITMFTGAGSGVSRYDATTKTIYVYWNYNNNPLRAFFDTLTFLRAR